MNRLILILFVLLSVRSDAQKVIDTTDHMDFKSLVKHRSANTVKITSEYSGQFKNKEILHVETVEGENICSYYVIDSADYTDALAKEMLEWFYVQSCSYVVGDKLSFYNFSFQGQVYIAKECTQCSALYGNDACAKGKKRIFPYHP